MSTPATTIYLCKGVRLNNKYDHTIYFSHSDVQEDYFRDKVDRTLTGYTYIRRTWKLKVQASMESARQWSYLFFRNNGVHGKIYYYFINQIEYINDNTVELSIEMDVMQTYMFDWTLLPCYVEREHSETDEIYENTVDEGLDVGDYVNAKHETIDFTSDICIMVASTIDINKFYFSSGATVEKIWGANIDNVFGAFQITAVSYKDYWDDLAILLNYLTKKGQIDAIYAIWQYPKKLLQTHYGTYDWTFAEYASKSKLFAFDSTGAPSNLDGYVPRNKKLFQYPYMFMYASNNNGGAAVYRYEYFDDRDVKFICRGNIAPDGVIKLLPFRYQGMDENINEALTMSNFPVCAWNNDVYKLWLAQNQNTQNLNYALSGLKIVGGAAAIIAGAGASGTGIGMAAGVGGISAGASLVTSGITDITSQLAQRADKEIQPPQSKGTYSGNFNIANGLQNFEIYHRTIDARHAHIIDDYFTMYGYATRLVKVPNINSRPRFNYVKTVGSNVTGDFCQEDILTINAIFDKGITFWKSGDAIGEYFTASNAPTT